SPLHAASYKRHVEAARALLDHGSDVNATRRCGRTALCAAHDGGHLVVMWLLIEYGAIGCQDHGIDIDVLDGNHCTPLFCALCYGHLEVARLLLQHGADAHIPNESGRTPFEEATLQEHTSIVRLLSE
ncbi:ankyrin repeat protein, partial [Russula earlei]